MDFDLKLKALTGLAASPSKDAQAALIREVQKSAAVLQVETQYEILWQQLTILKIIGYRVSDEVVQALEQFIERLRAIEISYSEEELAYGEQIKTYRNASSLTVNAIEALSSLRYLETRKTLAILLRLSSSEAELIQKRAIDGLQELASYHIGVISGTDLGPGIGFAPQKTVIRELAVLEKDKLQEYFSAIIALAANLLSPTMEQISSTYKSLTIASGEVPIDSDISDIRLQTVELLKRLYGVSIAIEQKIAVIGTLTDATRWRRMGIRQDRVIEIVSRDTQNVLMFFKELVKYEDFAVVQKIEHQSYWIFHHAISDLVEKAALEIEAEIGRNPEYQIYKTLIGFEGIFDDWVNLKAERRPRTEESEYREEKARGFVSDITPDTFAVWKARLLKFSRTRSNDLATFPVFYHFLEQVALAQPGFALSLLNENADDLKLFLIPLIRGLFGGPKSAAIRALISQWAAEGKHLYPSIKQFMTNEKLDLDLLDELLTRAIELDDTQSIALTMAVVASNYKSHGRALVSRFFMPALDALTVRSNADWVLDIWYRAEMETLIGDLKPSQVDRIFDNIMHLARIDYHTEEILDLLAQKEPKKVVQFFCKRLIQRLEDKSKSNKLYDAIPFELHKLKKPLSKIPQYAVQAVRELYDGNYGLFSLGGGRLLHNIFPDFPKTFEAELLRVLNDGGEEDFLFVLSVLRNYEGQPFLHHICKRIIQIVPADSELRTEVAVILKSTGVVTGEFGFADAFERKKVEVHEWLTDVDEKVRDFAKWYISSLENSILSERKRAEENIALRKQKYGE